MTMIESSIDYQLQELSELTHRAWKVNYNPEKGGLITQPNGIEVIFQTWAECLHILSETLEIVRKGDTKWCLN